MCRMASDLDCTLARARHPDPGIPVRTDPTAAIATKTLALWEPLSIPQIHPPGLIFVPFIRRQSHALRMGRSGLVHSVSPPIHPPSAGHSTRWQAAG